MYGVFHLELLDRVVVEGLPEGFQRNDVLEEKGEATLVVGGS